MSDSKADAKAAEAAAEAKQARADSTASAKVCFYSARAAFLRSHVSDASPHYCLSSASRPIA